MSGAARHDGDRFEVWSLSAALGRGRAAALAALGASGLIDRDWYVSASPVPDGDAVAHFHDHGWREGRQPNPYFATAWYLERNPDVARAGADPLLHYVQHGEAERRAPAPWFDLEWYAGQHPQPPGHTLLWHFLQRRFGGSVSPLPEFDPAYYLATYPDIAAAGIDPFEHYLRWGYREGRNPSAGFDTNYYLRRYLDGDLSENPLLHYHHARRLIRLHPVPQEDEVDAFEQVRRMSRPGPLFETRVKLPEAARRRARVLAYYLPQFHPIAENDAWWGEGFTEWTSLARAMPRFRGHYQPRIPRDLGHYSLADPETMRRQIALAREAGLAGFVHYFYWFNGRRLLDRPTEAMLADRTLDFPFCLMWANENWTRRWDGSDDEVLIAQDWRSDDEGPLLACFARHFADPRYIRVEGRPLLMLYRPALIPDTRATLARWRRVFREAHGEEPLIVMAQSFDASDPLAFGCDGAVEFPPHKLVAGLPTRNQELRWFDPRATAQVYAYDDVVAASLAEEPPAFPLIKTAIPGWDNDARRQGAGLVVHGATPARYQAWLSALVERAAVRPFFGEALVCVNAWNEWAEGAYLEPDRHFGAAFLNATARAISGLGGEAAGPGLLLVGHDAFPAGAQMLLLHLARTLRAAFGARIEVLLLGDGALRAEYAAVAPTRLVATSAELRDAACAAAARGFGAALVNSAAAAGALGALAAEGIGCTLLVHEMPRLIAEKRLGPALAAGIRHARTVVFPAEAVREAFAAVAPVPEERVLVAPQGVYRPVAFSARRRAALRERLGLGEQARLVLGAGYGDLRKGFDLFLQAWREAARRDRRVVFCWIGALDPALETYLAPEIEAARASGRFLLPGHQDEVADWFCAADAFALTSREDPCPSVVLEALSAGLRCVAFAGSGGIPALLAAYDGGRAVAMADAGAMARALVAELRGGAAAGRADGAGGGLAAAIRRDFAFTAWAERMLRTALPGLARISVVLPGYDYARYLPARLASIFAQTHPVAEILVLDDASRDASPAVAARTAAAAGRHIRQVVNGENSGGVFRQWRRGVELARGDWVWIAEADDEAEPGFLATLAGRLAAAPDVVMALCDSRSVDAAGQPVWPDYQGYYAKSGAAPLARDALFPAREFARHFLAERNLILNVSAVLWRREALLAALERCGPALDSFQMAGDWRLYLEFLGHSGGQVAWVAEPLNVHRRHPASVTARLAPAAQADEIARAQTVALELFADDATLAGRQEAYRRELAG